MSFPHSSGHPRSETSISTGDFPAQLAPLCGPCQVLLEDCGIVCAQEGEVVEVGTIGHPKLRAIFKRINYIKLLHSPTFDLSP